MRSQCMRRRTLVIVLAVVLATGILLAWSMLADKKEVEVVDVQQIELVSLPDVNASPAESRTDIDVEPVPSIEIGPDSETDDETALETRNVGAQPPSTDAMPTETSRMPTATSP